MKVLPTKISSEKICFFESVLLDFFEKAGREHLPWRREGISAYEVWVSEIMLQQTQVSRVIGYYEKFLKQFPTVQSLARASWEEFLPYYAGLGYYARGRNMLRTAKMVVDEYDGRFPNDIGALQKLPGIGSYTAAAISSFAYGEEQIAWDTNLRRVIGRFFFGTKRADEWRFTIGNSRSRNRKVKKLEKRSVLNERNIRISAPEAIGRVFSVRTKTLNAALMDFGSAICLGRPKCSACPLRERCRYFREGGKQELGKTDTKKPVKERLRSDWKNARVEATLHENHQKYFSSLKTSYRPFVLDAAHNTRAGIKQWFRERYGLEVAVRPPHDKVVISRVPTLRVNVQILSGNHDFTEFSRTDISAT